MKNHVENFRNIMQNNALIMQQKCWIRCKFHQLIKLKLIPWPFPICKMYHIKHNEKENTSVLLGRILALYRINNVSANFDMSDLFLPFIDRYFFI